MAPTWRPSPEDFTRVFTEQNPWQHDGDVPAVLAPPVERSLVGSLVHALTEASLHRFHLVLGPRRVGKTTVMYQTVRRLVQRGVPPDRLWWMRLDHPLLMDDPLGAWVDEITQAAGATDDDPVFLFLDELVYADRWDVWLKTFYDERWPVRVVATSSATAALRDRRLESGVGRWTEHYLPPFLFSEYLDLLEVPVDVPVGDTLASTLEGLAGRLAGDASRERRLRQFLLVGGFPELILATAPAMSADDDEHASLLRSQQVLRSDAVERAIYKDIPQSFGLDNPLLLERFLYVLAGQVTGVLSPTRLAKELGVSQPTLDRYLSYLERAFLVFTLPNYSGNEAAVQRRGRKAYFTDSAVRNAALLRGIAPLSDPVELGCLVENLVAANLHALATRSGMRLFHWRDGHDEVDLVLDHPTDPLAFEIGLSATHSRAGLSALCRRHPRFEGRCWLVAPGARFVPPSAARAGIGTLPLDVFVIAVGRQAERALERQFSDA